MRFKDDVDLVVTTPPPPQGQTGQQRQVSTSQPRYGQKRFPATSIERGDRFFWSRDDGVDLMMAVSSITTRDGTPCLSFKGMKHTLDPVGVGQPITGSDRGEATWTIPESKLVDKAVPWEEADHGNPGDGGNVAGDGDE